MNPNVLLLTLVIALEPLPVLGGVLLLTAERGRPKAIGFLLGWAFALAVIGVVIVLVGGEVSTSSGSTSSKVSAGLDIVLGLVLAAFALRTRAKAAQGTERATPGWMKRLDTMSPVAAFALGAFLPPYLLAVAVGNEIVRARSRQHRADRRGDPLRRDRVDRHPDPDPRDDRAAEPRRPRCSRIGAPGSSCTGRRCWSGCCS